MPISLRWVEPGRVLAVKVTDADDANIGETTRLTGDLADPAKRLRLVRHVVAESCARTGAKP